MNQQNNTQVLISALGAQPDSTTDQELPPLSCEIKMGKMVFLVGSSQTISLPYMNILAGLDFPVSGQVSILQKECQELSQIQRQQLRQDVGFILKGGPLLSAFSGLENLKLAARYHQKGDEKFIQHKAQLLLEEMPVELDQKTLPAYMSNLQKRLLAIARPLMLDPKILFIDSPFDGLDHNDKFIIARYISKIARNRQITLVLCSDDLYFMHSIADQIIFCDLNDVLVFDNWLSFYHSKRETIALLFKYQHIKKDA